MKSGKRKVKWLRTSRLEEHHSCRAPYVTPTTEGDQALCLWTHNLPIESSPGRLVPPPDQI